MLTGHRALRVEADGATKVLVVEAEGPGRRVRFDAMLVTIGRTANRKGFGVEALDVTAGRTVDVNDDLRTSFPNIFAAGHWKRTYLPRRLLAWLVRYRAWRRG